VITFLNKNYVSIKVNTDVQQALSSEFGIRGIPDNWFLSENKKPIINQPGYLPSKLFLPILKYIHTDSFKTMSLSKFMRKKE
jgi:thioredoxin-related protein